MYVKFIINRPQVFAKRKSKVEMRSDSANVNL